MTNPNDPAFVKPENLIDSQTNKTYWHTHGLTKREYFAGLAMQGLLKNTDTHYPLDAIIEASVGFADRLIVELSREDKSK